MKVSYQPALIWNFKTRLGKLKKKSFIGTNWLAFDVVLIFSLVLSIADGSGVEVFALRCVWPN